jgi:hypothetical protein
MGEANAYLDTLVRLSESPTGVRNEIALEATRLADVLAGFTGTVARGEEAMQRFDGELDRLLAPAVAVIATGSRDDLHVVTVALDAIASAASGPSRPHTPLALGMLSRAALTMTAAALAWRRLGVLVELASVMRSDGYGSALGVLADIDLRHLDLFDGAADAAFQAHLAWFTQRHWRTAVGVLASDDHVRLSFGEADVLCGMLAVADRLDRGLYSAGLALDRRRIADRLVARSREPRQRAALCKLFGVEDDQLETRMSDSYAGLTAGGRVTSFSAPLFGTG